MACLIWMLLTTAIAAGATGLQPRGVISTAVGPAERQPRGPTSMAAAPSGHPSQGPASSTAATRRSAVQAGPTYDASHPRLLFTQAELPALQQKVRDGGRDDAAYADILIYVDSIYPTKTEEELFQDTFGVNVMPNLGIAAYLETPTDQAALDFGRRITLYIADTYDPDDNVFYSPLRMRALAYGYDMFFGDAPDSLRDYVRSEILAYVDTTMTVFQYQRWLHNPYVSNISAMIGASLGIAALCLENEMPSEWVRAAVGRADEFVAAWHESLLDPDGSYHEGVMYAGWSMRNLAYYFWARKRLYDRFDYSTFDKIRNLEKWIAFSTLPIGGAAVNNVNDTAYLNHPLSRHHTYLDWAQTAWASGVSAWLWERFLGPDYGHESAILADKAATVLWHRNLEPTRPGDLLPRRTLWRQHGLYYFRTGWPEADASDDVVFSFYSGKFRGGHAHEDQGNFTLWAYGTAFATDNGFGGPAKESEAHNLVFIDGKGEHNAGGSVGTDGKIREDVLSGFADYVFGEATSAYTTYSEFNRPGYPFPDDDWSFGYDGGNPVEFAYRRVIAVHEASSVPYFVIADEVRKDGLAHVYSWRLHTHQSNTIDASSNPMRIEGERGTMGLLVLSPPFDSLAVAQTPYDNGNDDPNTTVLSLSIERIDFQFCLLLLPTGHPPAYSVATHHSYPWGGTVELDWADGASDLIVFNHSGERVSALLGDTPGDIPVATDARVIVLRTRHGDVSGALAADASLFDYGGIRYAAIRDGRTSFAIAGDTVVVGRADVAFSFYLPEGGIVRCGNAILPVFNDGGYVVPDRSGTPQASEPLRLRSFPNPFTSITNVIVDIEESANVTVRVFDVQGRLVTVLWDGQLPKGSNLIRWPAGDAAGPSVATGVYFVRADAPNASYTIKAVVIR